MDREELNNWIDSYLKPPFKYDKSWTYIWDNENHMVAQVRWWGSLQKEDYAEQKQDEIWKLIVVLLNDYYRHKSD